MRFFLRMSEKSSNFARFFAEKAAMLSLWRLH